MRAGLAALALLSSISLLSTTSTIDAGSKVIRETWDAVYLGDGRAGHVRTSTREITQDGKPALQTTVELRLTVKRFKETLQMAMDTSSVEDADGKVLAVSMKQFTGQQTTHIEGTIVGNQVQLMLNGKTRLQPAPWTGEVLGLCKQQDLFKGRNLKPGDRFTYRRFEPTVNLVVSIEVAAKAYREIELPGARGQRKLLFVEATPASLEYRTSNGVQRLQLPATQYWLDESGDPVKTQFELPGLGQLSLVRSTKEQALAPGSTAKVSDVGLGQFIRLPSRIARPQELAAAVYRITLRDEDPSTAFASDGRQQVKKVQGNTLELRVHTSDSILVGPHKEAAAPAAEFAQSSYFINSTDGKVRELANRAVGSEKDPWKKALRIERWVHEHMRPAHHTELAPADQVARTLTGDCTEYAMLTAALCRAGGLPSRTAVGVIYAEVKGEPGFAFHMWTEVWVNGAWRSLDATLGRGGVGATHLKIADQSWHEERTLTPLLPISRILGRVQMEVLSLERR